MRFTKQRNFFGLLIISFVFLLALIFSDKTSAFAAEGIALCLQTLVPSLFPFFVMTNLLLQMDLQLITSCTIIRRFSHFVSVSENGLLCLLVGLLGSYPIGAHTACRMYECDKISKSEAENILAVANNTGPAFIIGFLGASVFHSAYLAFLVYLNHILAVLFTLITPGIRSQRCTTSTTPMRKHTEKQTQMSAVFPDAIRRSVASMLQICGFVIFFTVLAGYLKMLPLPQHEYTGALFLSLLELSTGACACAKLTNHMIQFISVCGLISWGGLCIHCQTASIASQSQLSMQLYWRGKIVQTCYAICLGGIIWCFQARPFFLAMVLVLLFCLSALFFQRLPCIVKKKTGNAEKYRV